MSSSNGGERKVEQAEEEAAAFKRKKEQSAARVARHRERQRTGAKPYTVLLPKSVIRQLIRRGHVLPDADAADIGKAVAKILE